MEDNKNKWMKKRSRDNRNPNNYIISFNLFKKYSS